MKTHKLLTLAAAISLSSTASAQTFNTISNTLHRPKVERAVVPKTKEASADTSYIYIAPHDTLQGTKKTERTRYPLVSYPLRQEKLVVTSPYGWRRDPFDKSKTTFHSGVDLRARFEPVYAMLPGEVIRTGYDDRAGHFITLKHGDINVSYCHLSLIGIAKGETVHPGQPIGMSGDSGRRSTAPHLHLTVKSKSKSISATDLLSIIGKYLSRDYATNK